MADSSAQAALLISARMYLRQFQPEDAQLLFELDADPEVMRFISKGQGTPLERIQSSFIPRFLQEYRQSPTRGIWATHLRAGNEFIGWFHLRPDRLSPGEMDLGYRLKRSVWGQGLATEGSIALLHAAFREWGYPKVCARTLLANLASQRVMKKAGLTYEGDFLYGPDVLPGWNEHERKGVKYVTNRETWCAANQPGV